MTGYLDHLAARLRDRGVPPDRVTATVGDLAAYLAETGTGAEAEFGPVGEFAAQLSTGRGAQDPAPEPGAETWRGR